MQEILGLFVFLSVVRRQCHGRCKAEGRGSLYRILGGVGSIHGLHVCSGGVRCMYSYLRHGVWGSRRGGKTGVAQAKVNNVFAI